MMKHTCVHIKRTSSCENQAPPPLKKKEDILHFHLEMATSIRVKISRRTPPPPTSKLTNKQNAS